MKEQALIVIRKKETQMNQNKNKIPILIGILVGLAFSILLYFTQNNDLMFYFSGAPYYIDSLIFHGEGFVSTTAFVYFMGLFGLLGYFLSIKLNRWYFILFCIFFTVTHFLLLKLAGDAIFSWMKH